MISQPLSLVMPAYMRNDHRHTIAMDLAGQPDTIICRKHLLFKQG